MVYIERSLSPKHKYYNKTKTQNSAPVLKRCECCKYETTLNSNFMRHLESRTHQKRYDNDKANKRLAEIYRMQQTNI